MNTLRLRLRFWQEADRAAFAALKAAAEVMRDLGGPLDITESNAKFDRFAAAQRDYGLGRWLVETHDGDFVGYAGVMKGHANHPLGEHFEIGWRLARAAWGKGYATEAAKAALHDAFARARLTEVLAFTAADNTRSQAVMRRLALTRDPARDFTAQYEKGKWHGLVWFARSASHPSGIGACGS